MRKLLFALGIGLTAIATSQNFPEFPPSKPLSPRGQELLQRIRDKHLIPEPLLAPTNPRRELDAVATCDKYLALVSLQLGLIPGFHDGYGLSDWVWHLPLVEAFLSEVYGGREKLSKDMTANIALIRNRAKLLDLSTNESAYQRFSDVPKGHWADEAIHRMRELGIIRGYPDNTFRGG